MNPIRAPDTTEHIPAPRANSKLAWMAVVITVTGVVLCVSALLNKDGYTRFGFAYLWGFTFLWSIVLGSLFFVALQHLTHSVWSVGLRRVAEMFASPMWLVGILLVPVLLFGVFPEQIHVYPWLDVGEVEHNHLLQGKQAYLNFPFFAIRAIAFFILWIGFAVFYIRTSLKQDHGQAGAEATVKMRKMSAPFMLIFALTVTFAGIDWIMSLNPYWFSTIFGVYIFSGMAVASLSAITIAVVYLRKSGRLGGEVVTDDHLYNLGALLFAFVCFWAYIAFSQYMLIWYGNIPEESFYMVRRMEGGWLRVSIGLAMVRFFVPFVVLLSRRAKMNPTILLWISMLMLAGQLLDLYWLIMPEYHQAAPVLGWQEWGPLLL
ncbi:MAG: hypothetical protein ACYTA5_01010, partial [Planctomycetota bacterium]